MPYRRLPNTNQARINSLRMAVEQAEAVGFSNLPFSYKLQNDAVQLLSQMERAVHEYQIAFDQQMLAGKEYLNHLKMARLYISHFIQVFNLCVIRGEIKAEMKDLYQLPMDSSAVPDLSTEAALLKWGKNIIDGEQARIKRGGAPVYNPSIGKVKVFYDIFMEAQNSKVINQNNTRRAMNRLEQLHESVDALIVDIWDQVENFYKDLPPRERRLQCQKFGVLYYFRKGEKEEE